MYTFSSKLKLFIHLNGFRSFRIGYFLTAPKDIQEVEKLLAAESHGGHGKLNMRQWQLLLMPCSLNMSKVAKLRKKVLTKQVLNVDTVNSTDIVQLNNA
jgi:hypothetical protein